MNDRSPSRLSQGDWQGRAPDGVREAAAGLKAAWDDQRMAIAPDSYGVALARQVQLIAKPFVTVHAILGESMRYIPLYRSAFLPEHLADQAAEGVRATVVRAPIGNSQAPRTGRQEIVRWVRHR